jgi:hypothetical protein
MGLAVMSGDGISSDSCSISSSSSSVVAAVVVVVAHVAVATMTLALCIPGGFTDSSVAETASNDKRGHLQWHMPQKW